MNEEESKMLDAQARLAEIMNDTPRLVKLEDGREIPVTMLRNGTQYLICKEAVEVVKNENATFGDVMKQFAVNMPAVARVLTLAVLNDKERIFKDGDQRKGWSDEFEATCDTFLWDVSNESIAKLMYEVFSMLDINFFLTSSGIVKTMRETMTKRATNQPKS